MLTQAVDSRLGPEGFIVDWVRALAAKVERLVVLTYNYSSEERLPGNVRVVIIEGNGRLGRMMSLFRQTAALCVSENIDVIFGHMIEVFGIAAAIVGKILRKKSVFWYCQGYDLRKNYLAKLALFLPEKIITCSLDLIDKYAREVGRWVYPKTTDVGIGINVEKYSVGRRAVNFNNKKTINLAYTGRIAPIKDILMMLEAVENLLREGVKVYFRMVGDWGLPSLETEKFKQEVRSRVSRMNRKGRVVIIEKPKPYAYRDSQRVYRNDDLYICPGLKTFLEVISAGRPAISISVANTDMQKYFPRLIYQTGNSQDLTDKLRHLIQHPKATDRMMTMAREHVRKVYDLPVLMERVVKVFEEN